MMTSSNSINRYSMPVVRSRNGIYESELDGNDVTRFLWDEDSGAGGQNVAVHDEPFPVLVRRDNQTVSGFFSYTLLIFLILFDFCVIHWVRSAGVW